MRCFRLCDTENSVAWSTVSYHHFNLRMRNASAFATPFGRMTGVCTTAFQSQMRCFRLCDASIGEKYVPTSTSLFQSQMQCFRLCDSSAFEGQSTFFCGISISDEEMLPPLRQRRASHRSRGGFNGWFARHR